MFDELDLEFDHPMLSDPIEYMRMFFIFDSVLENSNMDTLDAIELFELIQQQTLQ